MSQTPQALGNEAATPTDVQQQVSNIIAEHDDWEAAMMAADREWLACEAQAAAPTPPAPAPLTVSTADARTFYDYRDEYGTVLYQSVRSDMANGEKTFRLRKPSRGGWANNVKDIRRVLYRLPELLAANPLQPVFVVEGEKCANVLAALGAIVTTNAGGAEKWPAAESRQLAGRRVVILPDNDDPGRRHAQQVARSVVPFAAEVKIVELSGANPEGYDVADWITAGNTLADLERLAELAPRYVQANASTNQDDDRDDAPATAPKTASDSAAPSSAATLADRHATIISKLMGVQSSGTEDKALCPAHSDSTPSLTIRLGNDRIFLKCHKGCSFESIVAALGIQERDTYAPPKSSGQEMARSVGTWGAPGTTAVTGTTRQHKTHASAGHQACRGNFVKVSEREAEPVEWLWPRWIARGMVSMVYGKGGVGKGNAIASLAAIITTGGTWPDGSGRAPLGNVLMLIAEDHIGNAIRPRLDAAQADVDRVTILDSVTTNAGTLRSPSLADLHIVENHLSEHPETRLIVIDPILSFLDGKDSNKATDYASGWTH